MANLLPRKYLRTIVNIKNQYKFITSFISTATLSGFKLFLVTVLAVYIANSTFAPQYFEILETHFSFSFGTHTFSMSLQHWINDVLMAIFFLVVGLEIKRDMLIGELSSLKKASFPIIAALGGMIVPALVYLFIDQSHPTGFGVPMATDIAFALGILMLLGKRVSLSIKVFLVTLAVVDDLGAILVVAIFYTNELHYDFLIYSALTYFVLMLFNYFNLTRVMPYLFVGIFLWIFVHSSGIHSTIAGILLAFVIPLKANKTSVEEIEEHNSKSPLLKLEHALHNFSAFLIMPLFAFANAGVALEFESVIENSTIVLGVFFGLVIGKPIGILLFTYLATLFKISEKPSNVSWREIVAVGFLAGIGFTMSIFISHLAFSDPHVVSAVKIAVFASSITAAVIGVCLLLFLSRKNSDIKEE
ncbi:Na(+)/H(+) antiporter NhaA [Aliarcobacter thereius]|uniref:Na(+)/H(+) antiporter NhaA n=3 Tax=Arcobacteraceae TaxID=2808963 RepID=A0A1C0B6K3_9BACT|nr:MULTISPECIES: Na+/H+ antiporter NhaA [Arcobacteraceae]OCL86763.1 Na(+)/H(+) antiporter NhaA [Aliarcobacter thereius]OCL90965.1 Na(+)/H(+) antiporter NhaA [Aliarcobacter thereius]OCL93224.1 Na(+)/H(+) antiporter NhaA [Arcobacter porcinus]OCL96206.1 Na(+)/H(+) antiporter NhaA [Aliarcobacter thereius LMG 24486]OCL98932.1 Na(+)/H(+) antiporter NhaA [Aliarcobacter thereius]